MERNIDMYAMMLAVGWTVQNSKRGDFETPEDFRQTVEQNYDQFIELSKTVPVDI